MVHININWNVNIPKTSKSSQSKCLRLWVHWLVVQHKLAGLNHILVQFKTQSVSFVNDTHVSDVMIETDTFKSIFNMSYTFLQV